MFVRARMDPTIRDDEEGCEFLDLGAPYARILCASVVVGSMHVKCSLCKLKRCTSASQTRNYEEV